MLKNEPLVSFPFMFGKIELANLTGIQQFLHRVTKKFSHFLDNTLYEDMNRLLVLCGQEFLSRRDSKHIARMVCAQHFIRKTFFRSLEDSDTRFAAIRFLPSTLFFPFLSKPVLGLMIGVSLKDKYELFTEEHLIREESINYPKWENKTYQTLFDKGQQEKDLNRRLTYFSQAEELLVQEVPVIPIARVLYGALQKNHLCFNTRASFRSWDLKWASIKKKENI